VFVELSLIGSFIGGIGLFLLGMKLMTDGLKVAAGQALRHILGQWTRTPMRGFFSGILITSLVQSSSAVTVAVIGFVNAGLLSLLQTSYVIYGTNIGTTMTSWLVALVGFKINVQAFSLPFIGLGMFLHLFGGANRRGAMGMALAGFGLFFLGIGILKDAFGDVGSTISFADFPSEGLGLLLFTAMGFLLTFLMQSSSAAMAVTLTAAAGGLIPLTAAAATVIGANVGTTTTAAMAVIGATPNAQRTAAVHVLFNLITAITALLLLTPLLWAVRWLSVELALSESVATELAMFHTLFNILGVGMLWFTTPHLVRWLERRLRAAEEDRGRPVYLDRNVLATPALALNAVVMELERTGGFARQMLLDALSSEHHAGSQLHRDRDVLERLSQAVNEFTVEMQRAHLPEDVSEHLPVALRIARYYLEGATLAVNIATVQEGLDYIQDPRLNDAVGRFRGECASLLALSDPMKEGYSSEAVQLALGELESHYQKLKTQLLHAGSDGHIRMPEMVGQLNLYSEVRRAMEQSVKGANYLRGLAEWVSHFQKQEEPTPPVNNSPPVPPNDEQA
jgi:phosphate:Na+ symporter